MTDTVDDFEVFCLWPEVHLTDCRVFGGGKAGKARFLLKCWRYLLFYGYVL